MKASSTDRLPASRLSRVRLRTRQRGRNGTRCVLVPSIIEFQTDPSLFVTGVERERAIRSVRCYRKLDGEHHRYTGSVFDRLTRESDPLRFTPNDVVAVNMLSVGLKPDTADWLLSDHDGRLTQCLSQLP